MLFLLPDLSDTAEQLALEELILDQIGDSANPEGCLLLWEQRETCVVIGLGNRLHTEVHPDRCRQDGVPIYRRISGGGAVVQGPGCLNYSLVLPIDHAPELQSVTSTNQFIMGRISECLTKAEDLEISVRGDTDLVHRDRKVAGNSQKRTRNTVLFHGTLLLDMDLDLIPRYLPMPSRQPDYRAERGHLDFVSNLPMSMSACRNAIRSCWCINDEAPSPSPIEASRVESRAGERYRNPDWTSRI